MLLFKVIVFIIAYRHAKFSTISEQMQTKCMDRNLTLSILGFLKNPPCHVVLQTLG